MFFLWLQVTNNLCGSGNGRWQQQLQLFTSLAKPSTLCELLVCTTCRMRYELSSNSCKTMPPSRDDTRWDEMKRNETDLFVVYYLMGVFYIKIGCATAHLSYTHAATEFLTSVYSHSSCLTRLRLWLLWLFNAFLIVATA